MNWDTLRLFHIDRPTDGDIIRFNGIAFVNTPALGSAVPFNLTTFQITNMPVALTEFNGTARRTRADLSGASEVRLVVDVVTASGLTDPVVRLQYSTDDTTFATIGSSDVQVNIGSGGSGTTRSSSWITLVAGARADVYLRLVTVDGNAGSDPDVGSIIAYFR